MTNLTISQALSAYAAIEQLSRQRLSPKAAYWLAHTKRKLSAAHESFIETRANRATELEVVASDAIDEKAASYEQFVDDMQALLGQPSYCDVHMVSTSLFDGASLPFAHLVPLLPLFTDETGLAYKHTDLSLSDAVDAFDILSTEALHQHPFRAAYALASIYDMLTQPTDDYRKMRSDRGLELGVVTKAGNVRNDHPLFNAYVQELQDFMRDKPPVGLRHPILNPEHFGEVPISPVVFDLLWFAFDE